MKAIRRRHFLRGAAGFTLALPFLESLVKRGARAGEPPFALQPRFVAMTTQHGGVWGANMFPADATAPSSEQLYPGHTMHYGALQRTVEGGMARVSPVLRAPEGLLTERLVSKMNVIRGLDIMFYIGHHAGGELGNYASNDGQLENPTMEARPTIDQVMAYSPSFYPTPVLLRSMHVGTHENHCWGYANPSAQAGAIESIPLSQSAQALFNQIFVPEDSGPAPRPLVVDRVVESYRRLHDGAFGDAKRLGAADRQRLSDHMDRLRDLETRLASAADCSDVSPIAGDTLGLDVGGYSANVTDMIHHYRLYNDVIVAAFMCDTSRIAVINSGETWSTEWPGLCCDWHQRVAHEAAFPDGVAQQILVAAKREFFESVFLDLVTKLDSVYDDSVNEITLLDNTLVYWTQESGSTTHDPVSLPVISAGSAAGAFTTGRYLDYRDRDNTTLAHDYQPEYELLRPGLPYNRWLANVLLAMGVPASEFERAGERGYGVTHIETSEAWPSHLLDDMSAMLPHLAAGS
jgi:hypothetical protein